MQSPWSQKTKVKEKPPKNTPWGVYAGVVVVVGGVLEWLKQRVRLY